MWTRFKCNAKARSLENYIYYACTKGWLKSLHTTTCELNVLCVKCNYTQVSLKEETVRRQLRRLCTRWCPSFSTKAATKPLTMCIWAGQGSLSQKWLYIKFSTLTIVKLVAFVRQSKTWFLKIQSKQNFFFIKTIKYRCLCVIHIQCN